MKSATSAAAKIIMQKIPMRMGLKTNAAPSIAEMELMTMIMGWLMRKVAFGIIAPNVELAYSIFVQGRSAANFNKAATLINILMACCPMRIFQ